MNSHKATFYAQVVATKSYWDKDKIDSIRVVRTTQNMPDKREKNSILVKMTIEVPDAAFAPLMPEATIKIPESLIGQPEVTLEVDDATQDDA